MIIELEETKFLNEELKKENQRLMNKLKHLEYLYFIQSLRTESKKSVEYVPEFIPEQLFSTQPPVLKRSTNNLFEKEGEEEKSVLFDGIEDMDDLYLKPIMPAKRDDFVEEIQKLIDERKRKESIDDTALFYLKRQNN